MAQQYTIDQLLSLVSDRPDTVLQHLSSHPELAKASDSHGYSLLHAATSYNHASLLRSLVQNHNIDVNISDEDGESPLFVAETVEIARLLVEELHADVAIVNAEGQTAAEKMTDEDDNPLVAAYLRAVAAQGSGAATASVLTQTAGQVHPPPLPNGISDVKLSTMPEPTEADGQPDPEFRRRIEELAAQPDFEGQESQRQLRHLVQDAISGMQPGHNHHEDANPSARRRLN